MKILVYGAGVLGSYLAYEMNKAGHDVTILARGTRYNEIKENGLIIKHYVQRKTTITSINTIENFSEDGCYDAVFIAMQRTQIDNILPNLLANKKCKLYIFVGNNAAADETYAKIKESVLPETTVLFAFQGSGGRRESGKVVCMHLGRTSFSIGSLNGDISYRPFIDDIFKSTNFKLYHSPNMDAWLKYHVAFVEPLVYLTYWANGNLKKASKNREMLILTIDAIEEGYKVVKACGYPVEPKEDEGYVEKKRRKLYWMFKIMAATTLGRLAIRDHAMSAVEEMNCLSNEFDKLKKRAALSTPNWDKLEQYLIKKENLIKE